MIAPAPAAAPRRVRILGDAPRSATGALRSAGARFDWEQKRWYVEKPRPEDELAVFRTLVDTLLDVPDWEPAGLCRDTMLADTTTDFYVDCSGYLVREVRGRADATATPLDAKWARAARHLRKGPAPGLWVADARGLVVALVETGRYAAVIRSRLGKEARVDISRLRARVAADAAAEEARERDRVLLKRKHDETERARREGK